jgi:hypothetical protein
MYQLNKPDMDIVPILYWDGIDKILRIRITIVSLAYGGIQPPIALSNEAPRCKRRGIKAKFAIA